MTTTVIIGGVAGGMSTAARLRRRDEDMEIVVFEASEHVSFANCGLPYYVSRTIDSRDALLLQTPASLKTRLNLDVFVSHRVTSINRDDKTVTVRNEITGDERTQAYDYLVLSPGAVPFTPPIPGIERAQTLRTVEDVDLISESVRTEGVKSAAIIGGGFIGLELAENLHKLGIETTVVERSPQILAPLDEEMAIYVQDRLTEAGVKVITRADTKNITDSTLEIVRDNGDKLTVNADVVIAAIGVRPASELAREAGLAVGERGGIKVDRKQRTSDPAIFALGDAAEKVDAISGEDTLVPLAQTANRHGRMVADIITGRDQEAQLTLGTAIVGVLGLAAGSVGWNERRARAAGKNVRAIHIHPVNHAGYYPGATQLHLKLVVDADTDEILGAQAVGENGVDKRIDVIATAMRAGLKAADLADLELAYAPQFGSAKDPVNFLGFVDDNALGGEELTQWHELDDALADDNTILLDVRSAGEYANGNIPGAVNVNVDEMRAWLDDGGSDKLADKNVIVHCQVGLRGHIAAALLAGHGIKAKNLTGGYVTWSAGRRARSN
ncbi:MAG: FAD-dependent oxidoreductase [Corynebacterium sp.]|uniref:FAD-dependent oxidoreductase n=1 Tax=Corynebacterium sp. TaxID=1720 RepID=UPI0026DC281B|nr:FAD-dependent oxidoreductase [Corynebacterium sp.]MDO5030332.1 FAD-dependent oxidoreductase [Corynebacterium sp.]